MAYDYIRVCVEEFRKTAKRYAERAVLQDSIAVRMSLSCSAHDWDSAANLVERAIQMQEKHDYMASVSPEFHDAD